MNNILLEIFPESVTNLIIRFNIHPIAELFIKENQNILIKITEKNLNKKKEELKKLNNDMNEVYRRNNRFFTVMGVDNREDYEERLFLERHIIKKIEDKIKEQEDFIKVCKNIREFYDTLYFSYRRFNVISYHLKN